LAVSEGNFEIVEYLVNEVGADPNLANEYVRYSQYLDEIDLRLFRMETLLFS